MSAFSATGGLPTDGQRKTGAFLFPDATVRTPATSRPAVEPPTDDMQPRIPLDQLVKNYITGRREAYLLQGWKRFQDGDYRAACDVFGVAQSVSFDDPQAAIDVKVGLFWAGLASRQYALGVASLGMLLTPDARTRQFADPCVLNRLGDVASRYGKKEDLGTLVNEVMQLASVNEIAIDVKALRAVVLWGKNDRTQAMFYAQELDAAGTPEPWSRLYARMKEANGVDCGANATTTNQPATTAPASLSPSAVK